MSRYFKKYWGGWKPEVFRKDFKPNETKIILKNNKRQGFYVLEVKNDHYYFNNIQLSKPLRDRGVGTSIIKKIEKQVSKSKKKKIQLTVFKDNPAKRLYEKMGYSLLKDEGSSVLMEKKLDCS